MPSYRKIDFARIFNGAVVSFVSFALVLVQLTPLHAATANDIKQEFNRMKSDAARFDAYMKQLQRVQATDFSNENAAKAQLEALNRFKPDEVGRGFVASLIIKATRNRQFEAGIKQKAQQMGAKKFAEALDKDPKIIRQVPGVNAAENDVRTLVVGVKRKIDVVSEKVEQKSRQKRGEGPLPHFDFASLDRMLSSIADAAGEIFLIKQAKAGVFISVLTILAIAGAVLIVTAVGVYLVAAYAGFVVMMQAMNRIWGNYSTCVSGMTTSRTNYWGRELIKLGCWAAFVE